MNISAKDARTAELAARKQRFELAHLLRAYETRAPTSADVMRIRRVLAAAREQSISYDSMLGEPTTQRLFDCGALYFAHPQEI
jgi:hypothetical protein